MDNNQVRVFIYAMLSRVYSDILDEKFLRDLMENDSFLELLGEDTKEYFKNSTLETILEQTNIDFTSIFLMNAQPIESSVLDNKSEVLVGLQNPVMQFYYQHGYNINLLNTQIQTPDHIAIEFGFMQNLVSQENFKIQRKFLKKHLLEWVPQYLIGCKSIAQSPFYKDLFDFTVEFLISDYDMLVRELHNAKR